MQSTNQIKKQIRTSFQFLIDDFGFKRGSNVYDPIYSEIRYKKGKWMISITTIAHGTKISLTLVSPQKEIGFLNHLFPEEGNNTHSLKESIKFNSENLKEYGKSVLNANPSQFDTILKELNHRQMELINKWEK